MRLLRLRKSDRSTSQRQMAETVEKSAGWTDYLLKALAEKRQMQLHAFLFEKCLLGYADLTTPKGPVEKARPASNSRMWKSSDRDALRDEIRSLECWMPLAAETSAPQKTTSSAKKKRKLRCIKRLRCR